MHVFVLILVETHACVFKGIKSVKIAQHNSLQNSAKLMILICVQDDLISLHNQV